MLFSSKNKLIITYLRKSSQAILGEMKKGSSRPASPGKAATSWLFYIVFLIIVFSSSPNGYDCAAKKIEQEPQGLTEQEVKKIVQDCNTELSAVNYSKEKWTFLDTNKLIYLLWLNQHR